MAEDAGNAEDTGDEMTTTEEKTAEKAADFETALAELETIVTRLDRDELELDEALALFREGVEHLRTASRLLGDARGRVEELIETASGELSEVEFELPTNGSA